ncbi:unnamed protein product [Camellia sinensis]
MPCLSTAFSDQRHFLNTFLLYDLLPPPLLARSDPILHPSPRRHSLRTRCHRFLHLPPRFFRHWFRPILHHSCFLRRLRCRLRPLHPQRRSLPPDLGMHSMESQKKLETKLKRHKALEQSIENHSVSFQSKQKRPINLGKGLDIGLWDC